MVFHDGKQKQQRAILLPLLLWQTPLRTANQALCPAGWSVFCKAIKKRHHGLFIHSAFAVFRCPHYNTGRMCLSTRWENLFFFIKIRLLPIFFLLFSAFHSPKKFCIQSTDFFLTSKKPFSIIVALNDGVHENGSIGTPLFWAPSLFLRGF